jgi:hypothetical protein
MERKKMKWYQKRYFLLITILVLLSVLIASCSTQSTTQTVTSVSTQTVTTTSVSTVKETTTATVTSAPSTVTVTSSPSATTPSPTPAVFGSNTPKDAKFYTSREITSYITSTPNISGERTVTPVYSDVYVSLQEILRFTQADAVYVPRIPTLTTQDDWFVRFNIPTANLKPWLINWTYAVAQGDTSTTLSFYLFTKAEFEASYYKHPTELLIADLKSGDKGVSETGIRARLMQQQIGDFVILMRTNDASKILGWMVRIGM